MIYPLIFRLSGKSTKGLLLWGLILFIISDIGININVFRIGTAAHYLIYFHIGVILKHLTSGRFPKVKANNIIMPLMFVLWLLLLYVVRPRSWFTVTITGITAIYMMTGYELFNNIFSRFGAYSLQLYLLNGFTLVISRAIICNIFHVTNPPAIIAFNMLIDLLAAYIFIKYLCTKSRLIRFAMGL